MLQQNQNKINSIKKACSVTDLAFAHIISKIKEDVSEKEIVKEINKFLKNKSEGIAFRTIAAFGKNSAQIHHQFPTDKKLKNGDFVMLDFGAKINGYCSDITRVFVFGKASKEQLKMFNTVLKAQELAIEKLRSLAIEKLPIKPYELDRIARDYIVSKGYSTIPHSLGHGVGKKVHSGLKISAKNKRNIKPGAIFSIEPGIYIKDFGGVRIEDIILLKENDIEILTKSKREISYGK